MIKKILLIFLQKLKPFLNGITYFLLKNLILNYVMKGGKKIMNELIVKTLKAIMDNTEIDDKVYDKVAEEIKETIPGDDYEPIIGEVLEEVGKRLKQ